MDYVTYDLSCPDFGSEEDSLDDEAQWTILGSRRTIGTSWFYDIDNEQVNGNDRFGSWNSYFFCIVSFKELPLDKCNFLKFSVEHGLSKESIKRLSDILKPFGNNCDLAKVYQESYNSVIIFHNFTELHGRLLRRPEDIQVSNCIHSQ